MSGSRSEASSQERRRRPALRETLDDLINHVRDIVSRIDELSDEELEYAQQRLQWLADEVWQAAVDRDRESEAP